MRRRFGRYEVVRKLGEGAMAAVHLARDPVLTRPVAVKVLHGNVAVGAVALKRFFNEAKTIANVRNPHVVEVFDFGREGRDYYLVMEYVDGLSLKGILSQLGGGAGEGGEGEPLPELFTAALICQAAEGLDMAARMGVVHRDIKPENLMVNTQGYLKIADFGIAHLQDDSLTRTGAILGSPLYMSPEQVRGAKPITSQSDMFSLGAVMYRCLAGHPPFVSANLKDLYRRIARDPHPPLLQRVPGLDPGLAAIAEGLLRKDPAERGEGPRWLRGVLRSWLMASGVADPMELVCGHLEALSRRGIQTTWSDPEGRPPLPRTVAATRPSATLPAGTVRSGPATLPFALPEPLPREPRPWRRAALASLVALPLLGIAGYGLQAALARPRVPEGGDIAREGIPGGGGDSLRPHREEGKAGGGIESPATRDEGKVPDRYVGKRPEPGPEGPPPSEEGLRDSAHAAAGPAAVQVISSPPFAEVFLDGRSMGVTPLDFAAVPAGSHRLLLKAPGGASLDTVVELAPGRRTLRFRLEPGSVARGIED